MDTKAILPAWAEGLNCAITVCDDNCIILHMNERARKTYEKHGDLIGVNLRNCHSPRSLEIIDRLLAEGGQNAYTISKQDQRKMIYQSAWRRADGTIGGIVEISMVIPENLPHYDRG